MATFRPIRLVKLMFLLFSENVRSERELMRRLPERLDWLWFLGFGLEDDVPHHSALSKARTRWGGELFEELFVRTVRHWSWKRGRVGMALSY